MPFFDSNILSKIFYGTISSEIIRIARTTTDPNTLMLITTLLDRMRKQGSNKISLKIISNKLYNKHTNIFSRFAKPEIEFFKLFLL